MPTIAENFQPLTTCSTKCKRSSKKKASDTHLELREGNKAVKAEGNVLLQRKGNSSARERRCQLIVGVG